MTKIVLCSPVMHDSDSGIGIDFGISPILAGIGIGTGIRDFKMYWNRNRNRNQDVPGIVHH